MSCPDCTAMLRMTERAMMALLRSRAPRDRPEDETADEWAQREIIGTLLLVPSFLPLVDRLKAGDFTVPHAGVVLETLRQLGEERRSACVVANSLAGVVPPDAVMAFLDDGVASEEVMRELAGFVRQSAVFRRLSS